MGLSNDLISQFAKATNDTKKQKSSESTHFGTVVEYDGGYYVKLDGTEQLTPVMSTAKVVPGERVTVLLKDHSATVTGNITSPSASNKDVIALDGKVSQFGTVLADKVDTKVLAAEQARIDDLYAENATITGKLEAQAANIKTLEADNVTIKGNLEANSASIKTLETENVTIKGNLEAASASIKTLEADNATIKGELEASKASIKTLEADNVVVKESLTAANADIENLRANKLDASVANITYATITNLDAANARITNLQGDYGDFKILTADNFVGVNANIENLRANKLDAETARITYATITDLNAAKADISVLDADVADINTLIFGSASGTSIQTSFANAVIAQLGTAQIKSAMIESVSAGKITAGDIITNNVRVMSEDGSLLISDETIQISDDTRVRVQIGKDAANDYSINIWDANGNLMFSEGGITDSAIKEAIIRNDMVANNANIDASKLNIDSLFTTLNSDGSNTIKSSKIYLDDKAQTLDVAFTNMTTTVATTTSTANSALSAANAAQADIDELEVGGRNYIKYGKGNSKAGIFSHFNTVTDKYAEHSLTSQKQYVQVYMEKGFVLDCRDYEVGAKMVFSYDIMITKWDFPDGTTPNEWFFGQRYSTGSYMSVTAHRAPEVGKNGCVLNEWHHVEQLITIPTQAAEGIDTEAMIRLYNANADVAASVTFRLKNVKLEYGTRATDWTPAPEDLESDINAAQSTADSANSKADTNTSNLATLTTTVSTQGTQLSAVQGQIASKVWQSDITTAVEGIEIGGRNLFGFNKGVEIQALSKLSTVTTNKDAYGVDITITTGDTNGILCRLLKLGFNENGYFTFSATAHASIDNVTVKIDICDSNNTSFTLGTTKQKITLSANVTRYANSDGYDGFVDIEGSLPVGTIIHLENIKIERGNKATDWTPAPEDLEADITTLNSRYSDLSQTVDSITATVGQHTTQIANKADNSTVTTVSNRVTEVAANLEGFQSTVSSTYATKTELGDVQDELDNLEIGGRNLLRNSNFSNGTNYWVNQGATINAISDSTYGTCLSLLTASAGSGAYRVYHNTSIFTHVKDTEYTLSFYAKASSATTVQSNVAGDSNQNGKTYSVTTSWRKYTHTYTASTSGSLTFWPVVANVTVYLANIKLEHGNKSTDWTPAPEDIENRVTTAETKITQTEESITSQASRLTTVENKFANYSTTTQMNSAIEQKANSITSSVSATYATKTALAETQNELDNLSIGGRNLFKQSGHWTALPTWWISNGGGISLDTTTKYLGFNTIKTTVGNGIAGNNYSFMELDTNKVYTYSAMIKSDTSYTGTGGFPLHYHCATNSTDSGSTAGVTVINYNQTLVAGEWTLIYVTFQPKGPWFRPFVYIGSGNRVFNIAYLKLEEGNRATDWTPNPEDLASDSDLDALTTRVSSAETKITQTESSITSLASRTTTVENKFDDYSTTSEVNSLIEQKANSITSSVAATYTTLTDFNNLSIGGRNLVIGSGDERTCYNQLRNYYLSDYGISILDNGGKITISFEAKSDVVTAIDTYPRYGTSDSHTAYTNVKQTFNVTTSWARYSATISLSSSYDWVCFSIRSNASVTGGSSTATVTLRNVKVELGTKATDWTPAPEDVDAKFDDYSTTSEVNSLIEQKANSITSTVAATYATQSSLNSVKNTADSAYARTIRQSGTIDLSASTYDVDTYYPVVANTAIPASGYYHHAVNVQLNSNKPSWSTHDAGFTCNVTARMKAGGWGTTLMTTLGWIDDFTYNFCDKMPAYVNQNTNASRAIFYLRGGGIYYLYTDYDTGWTVYTSSTTMSSTTIAPLKTPSNHTYLINNWNTVDRVTSAESSITQLSNKITAEVTERTALATRVSTVEQTASGLTVSLQNTQNDLANLSIGGRNYYRANQSYYLMKSTDSSDGSQYDVTFTRPHSDCPNGFYIIGGKGGSGTVRFTNIITGNGDWTVSFWMRGSQSASISLVLDVCDSPPKTFWTTNDNSWKYIEYTCTVGNYTSDVYNFVDLSAIQWAYFYIKDFKVEKGNKATDWTAAPEDLEALSAKKINTYSRTLSSYDWDIYGSAGHSEMWKIEGYDNSHIKVGDTAYITGTIPDAGGTTTVYVMLYGTVTAVSSTHITMTTLYYIKSGEGGAYSLANTANSTANSALARTTVKDTRSDNQNPQWYMTNYPKQTVVEFKGCETIGISTSNGTYCSLETTVPWGDSSGGYPKQVAKCTTKKFYRVGTSATAWSAWVDEAATATNYLNFSSAGLVVGDMTASTLGKNVLIDSDSVDIRNGSTVLASFGANSIDLGMNGQDTVINLCGGAGQIRATDDSGKGTWGDIDISSTQMITISGEWGAWLVADDDQGPRGEVHASVTDDIAATALISADANTNGIEGAVVSAQGRLDGASYVIIRARSSSSINDTTFYTNRTTFEKMLVMPNNVGIYGKDTNGTERHMIGMSGSNNVIVGYGAYSSGIGNVHLYGNKIYHYIKSVGTHYKPYHEAGETINVTITTAGYVTNSKTQVWFTIPVSMPIIGNSAVNVASNNGLKIRQAGNYTHGSAASTWTKPDSYTAAVSKHHIRVVAAFSDTTNAVNNDPCGVEVSVTVTFA